MLSHVGQLIKCHQCDWVVYVPQYITVDSSGELEYEISDVGLAFS
jgi:hypothetical protein